MKLPHDTTKKLTDEDALERYEKALALLDSGMTATEILNVHSVPEDMATEFGLYSMPVPQVLKWLGY